MFHLDVKVKRPRNRPPSEGVLGFLAAAAAAVYDGIATAAAAVVAFFYRILFSEVSVIKCLFILTELLSLTMAFVNMFFIY